MLKSQCLQSFLFINECTLAGRIKLKLNSDPNAALMSTVGANISVTVWC